MNKINLPTKVTLGFLGLGFLAALITSWVTPWSAFGSHPYSDTGDSSRFYNTGNYQLKSDEYINTVYQRLKDADSSDTPADSTSATSNSSSSTANTTGTSSNSNSTSTTTSPSSAPSATASTTVSNSSSSSDAMFGITIAEADQSPYNRNDYGSGWEVSGLACNIRATILQRTSIVTFETSSNGCTVTYGSWVDPYSGATLTGNPYQGDGTSNDLDIDHIIPLKYVNSHGGYAWSSNQKLAYSKSLAAMNDGVYLAVSSSENRKKGDSGPADYYPSNPNYYCEYSRKWRDIARKYAISLSLRDYNKVKGVLAECGIN